MRGNFLLLLISLFSCTAVYAQQADQQLPKREFRGVWVATVENIDWPSRAGLSALEQQQELIALLDRHQRQNMNAIILQVRPAADAFYAKSREPWSLWLMGKQGVPPAPGYDPLEFAIREAHHRGMELHAWFNPYRATTNLSTVLSPNHITYQHPDWFFIYGTKKQFDPGIPQVRDYIVQVVLDVVKGYDVDGIHFDDYFYPYQISGQKIHDEESFKKYNDGFGDVQEWRRNNVNTLIRMLVDSIHAHKAWVKFGVSPRAIWKNKSRDPQGSATFGGDAYYENYADTRKWLREGWVDYLCPQIYFTFSRKAVPFATMTDWWSLNNMNRHLYIGHAAYLVNSATEAAWRQGSEIPNQIRYLRKSSQIQGSIFYSSVSLSRMARAVADSLEQNLYRYPALPPVMTWLDKTPPLSPQNLSAQLTKTGLQLKWDQPQAAADGEHASGYVVYRFEEGDSVNVNNPKHIIKMAFEDFHSFTDTHFDALKQYTYAVTALDRLKNESMPTLIEVGTEVAK